MEIVVINEKKWNNRAGHDRVWDGVMATQLSQPKLEGELS